MSGFDALVGGLGIAGVLGMAVYALVLSRQNGDHRVTNSKLRTELETANKRVKEINDVYTDFRRRTEASVAALNAELVDAFEQLDRVAGRDPDAVRLISYRVLQKAVAIGRDDGGDQAQLPARGGTAAAAGGDPGAGDPDDDDDRGTDPGRPAWVDD